MADSDKLAREALGLHDPLGLLVDSVQDYAIFLLDREGHIVTWNPGAQRIKGYAPEEILGKHFSVFYPREALERRWPQHELEIAAKEGRFDDEGWRVRKDGSLFWANVAITALRDEAGQVRGFAKITRDLTERRAQEELLRQSEERFRLLIEAVDDYAIFMLDTQGPRGELERRRRAHQGLSPRRDHRRAFPHLLHRRGPRPRLARGGAAAGARGRPPGGRGTAPAQGRLALLGQRRDEADVRPSRRAARLRQGDARHDRSGSASRRWRARTARRRSFSRCSRTSCATRWRRSPTR